MTAIVSRSRLRGPFDGRVNLMSEHAQAEHVIRLKVACKVPENNS